MNGEQLEIEKENVSYGVTTDGRGHLFVTDYNNECIQTFSASDDQYLGCLMKGSEAIGGIFSVQLSAETLSLVVSCYFQGKKWQFNVFNVQYPCVLL